MDTDLCYVASPILEAVIGKLNSLSDEDHRRLGTKISTLRTIIQQALKFARVAEDLVNKGGSSSSSDTTSICEWLDEAKSAAYDADDLLDQVSLQNNTVFYIFFVRIRMMSLRFNGLLIKGRQIIGETEEREIIVSMSRSSRLQVVDELMSISRSKNKFVFGLNCQKEAVVDRLMSSCLSLSVIAITGMAGIGKTTLARLVYQDEKVCDHFDLRAWVSVSANFASDEDDDTALLKIAKGIIESVSRFSCQLSESDNEDYYDLVRDHLESKRALIVLDDIEFSFCRFEILKEALNSFFSTAAFGSKVIVTTCSEEFEKTDNQHNMCPLSDEDSWSLFGSLAFDSSKKKFIGKENSQLYACAREIVAGCRGNPLALNLVGSLMRFKKKESDWLSFQAYHNNQVSWDSESPPLWGYNLHPRSEVSWDSENPLWGDHLPRPEVSHISRYVLLRYYDLPSHLKLCFAYCSIFKEDCVLEKEKMIRMWIAEGLVQPTQEEEEDKKTLEEIANDYFQELMSRSFFKDLKYDDFGDIIECRMHILIHYVAEVFAGIQHKKMGGVVIRQFKYVPQVSLACETQSSNLPKSLHFPKSPRTLLLLSAKFVRTLDNLFLKFKLLRVLDLSCSGIQRLSSEIRDLQHLRYLDLSHTHIEKLPSPITKIKYLETLKLLGCYLLRRLPERMHNMTKLRHLDLRLCHSLSQMPPGLSMLSSLQSMPLFVLGKTRECARLGDLGRLNLRGTLEIKNLENVRSVAEASESKLYEKENLNHLGLSWGNNVDGCSEMPSELVLESLRPHPNLKVLEVSGFEYFKFTSWMSNSSIYNLVKVSISNCGCEKLPPLGQLPYLKDLCVKGMINLKSIAGEFYGGDYSAGKFPSLEQFELYDIPNLEEWRTVTPFKESTSSILKEVFPCLNTLTVEGCSLLKGLPFLPALKNLVLWKSNEMLLDSLTCLPSISSLVINEFEFGYFPHQELGKFVPVKKLMLYHCGNLVSLFENRMEGFASVEHLGILCSNDLTSLGTGLSSFISLRKLDIIDCRDLARIPEVMEHLTLLRELNIDGCHALTLFPEGMSFLTSLQKLIIKRCPELSSLPVGLKRASTLQYLLIQECPQLEKRVEKDIVSVSITADKPATAPVAKKKEQPSKRPATQKAAANGPSAKKKKTAPTSQLVDEDSEAELHLPCPFNSL